MTTSGTFNFSITGAGIVSEAFDRISLRLPELEPHHLISARTSIALCFIEMENAGFNFWKLDSGTINLVPNHAVYSLPTNLVMLTELWYSNVNGGGAGVNQDRIMTPITRTEYAALTNKLQQGIPTQYWFQMLDVPQVTIWEVPSIGAPTYVLNWYGLQQMQDANVVVTESPDVPRRALEALIAKLTLRLCEKFGPEKPQDRQAMMAEKKALADIAWDNMVRRDQEPGVITYRPNAGVYARGLR